MSLVMLLLILDVSNYRIQLRSRIRESAEAFLPIELAFDPSLPIYEISRSGLDVANELRKPLRSGSVGTLVGSRMPITITTSVAIKPSTQAATAG